VPAIINRSFSVAQPTSDPAPIDASADTLVHLATVDSGAGDYLAALLSPVSDLGHIA
jgi:hypothetical protein